VEGYANLKQHPARVQERGGGWSSDKNRNVEKLKVYVNRNLKPSDNCKRTAIKATVLLKQILKILNYRDEKKDTRTEQKVGQTQS
jgi:hypothetical protein